MSPTGIRSGAARLGGLAAAAALALPAGAAAAPTLSVLAAGIDNPRHVALSPDGDTLYVAAAGRSGRACVGPRRARVCVGSSGRILSVPSAGGPARTVARGLLSLGDGSGMFSTGPDGVAVEPDGDVLTVIASGPPRDVAALPAGARAQAGELLRVQPAPRTRVASIDAFEWRRNSDGVRGDRNSNPYAVLALGDRTIVADAGANAILQVADGEVSLLATIRGPGRAQRVPSSLALGPDGAIYVGELAEGAGTGGARVLRIPREGGAPTVAASGFTAVTGVAFGPDGSMYVTQLSRDLRSRSAPGAVVRVRPDGSRTTFSPRGFLFPQGAAVAGNGDVYVSLFSVLPARTPRRGPFRGAGGQVVRISGL